MGFGFCRACGAQILWVRTVAGRSMPCDPEKVAYWETPGGRKRIVTPDGAVVSAELAAADGAPGAAPAPPPTGRGYVSHFATCPAADRLRKKRGAKKRC